MKLFKISDDIQRVADPVIADAMDQVNKAEEKKKKQLELGKDIVKRDGKIRGTEAQKKMHLSESLFLESKGTKRYKQLHVVVISPDMIEYLKDDLKDQGIKLDSVWVNNYDGFFFVKGYPNGWEVDNDDGYLTDECGLDEDELYVDGDENIINKDYIIDECGLVEWDGEIHY